MMFSLLIAAAVAAAPPQPADCSAHTGSQAALCRALAASAEKRFADAAQAFEAAASTMSGKPEGARALAAAGNMWIAAGQAGKAALALDRALAGPALVAEQRGEALLDRARAAEAQGDLKAARSRIGEASQFIAEDPFLWYFSAALALRENDVAAAKLAIGRALTLLPNDAAILFEAGHVAHAAGDERSARDYWERAKAADPKSASGIAAAQALAIAPVPMQVENKAR